MNKISNNKKILRMLKPYKEKTKRSCINYIIIKILTLILSLAQPLLFSLFIGKGLIGKDLHYLLLYGAATLILFCAMCGIRGWRLFTSNKITNLTAFGLKQTIFNNYLNCNYKDYTNFNAAALKMRIDDDVSSISGYYTSYYLENIFDLILAIIYLAFIVYISPLLTVFIIGLIPLSFFINLWISKNAVKAYNRSVVIKQESYATVHNTITNWKEIKTLGIERAQEQAYVKVRHKAALAGVKWIFWWGRHVAFNFFKDPIMSKVIIYLVASVFVIQGQLTIGLLVLFMQYFSGLFSSVNALTERISEINILMVSYGRIIEVLNLPTDDKSELLHFKELKDEISINNVTFRYNEGQENILNDFSLKIRKGEIIGIVGESGCGKSTLIKLLLGIYKPNNGTIQYDGKNIEEYDKDSLYASTGVIMQDNFFFNMSIEDNLKLAKRDAKIEELTEACKKAGIFEMINRLPKKFESIIGEKGVKFSGGEKQRLALAQIFLRKPQVLILDEPTSALDGKVEEQIINTLFKEKQDMTVIMVAHRLSTLKDADRIIKF